MPPRNKFYSPNPHFMGDAEDYADGVVRHPKPKPVQQTPSVAPKQTAAVAIPQQLNRRISSTRKDDAAGNPRAFRSVRGAGQNVNNRPATPSPWDTSVQSTFKSADQRLEIMKGYDRITAPPRTDYSNPYFVGRLPERAAAPTPAPKQRGAWLPTAGGGYERVERSKIPGGGTDVLETIPAPSKLPGETASGVSHPEREGTYNPITGPKPATDDWQRSILTRNPNIGVAGHPDNVAFTQTFNNGIKSHGDQERAMKEAEATMAAQQGRQAESAPVQTNDRFTDPYASYA